MVSLKKALAFALACVLVLSLAACGGSASQPAGASTGASAEGVKVAFIMAGSISDLSWNYNGYEGLKLMEAEGAEITYQENTEKSTYVEAARTYAAEGYRMVYINDNANQDDVVEAAADFPDTQFFICASASHADNVYPLNFSDGDQGFVMGLVAGAMTQTGKVGFVGGVEFFPIISCAKGFEQGVKWINPDAEVVITYTGSMVDNGAAKETAKGMYESGCDVVAPNADAASLGVIEAGEEFGGMTVGSGGGMEEIGPTSCIGYVALTTAVGYKVAYDQCLAGTLPTPEQGAQVFGIADGLVPEPFYNEGFTGVTDEIKAKILEGYNLLKSGEIKVDLS